MFLEVRIAILQVVFKRSSPLGKGPGDEGGKSLRPGEADRRLLPETDADHRFTGSNDSVRLKNGITCS